MAISSLRVDLIPPSQPNQPPSSNVFEVVEVASEKQDCDDEDEHEIGSEQKAEKVDEKIGYNYVSVSSVFHRVVVTRRLM